MGITGLSVRACGVQGVRIITWPTTLETEKYTQAAYTMGHCQGYRQETVCLYNVTESECDCVKLLELAALEWSSVSNA